MNIGQALRAASRPTISLEFFPPAQEEQLPDFYATADRLAALRPLFASVTYGAGGSRQHSTLNVTAELARRGWCAMAHLTCVGAQPGQHRRLPPRPARRRCGQRACAARRSARRSRRKLGLEQRLLPPCG